VEIESGLSPTGVLRRICLGPPSRREPVTGTYIHNSTYVNIRRRELKLKEERTLQVYHLPLLRALEEGGGKAPEN
jgi:hypothetical protein